jgi:hypothetical protein
MDIGRRELLTGLAAAAVTGVAPAPPIGAATVPLRPHEAAMLLAPWYFNHIADGTIHISHISGFSFYNAPNPNGSPEFICRLDEFPSRSDNVRAFERAASSVALHAYLFRAMRSHPGAIYFYYTQRDPLRPFADVYTEDAPEHPHLDRFYQIRYPYPDPRGGWFDHDKA